MYIERLYVVGDATLLGAIVLICDAPCREILDEAGTTTTPSSSQTAAMPRLAESHAQTGLSSGAIAGIAVGGLFLTIFVGALLFLLGRQTTMLQFMRQQE